MAKNYTLSPSQSRRLKRLWAKANPKAVALMDSHISSMIEMGVDIRKIDLKNGQKQGVSQYGVLGIDRGFSIFTKDLDEIKLKSQKGYEAMITRLEDFLRPDYEQRQVDRIISNIAKAVKTTYGENNMFEDGDNLTNELARKRSYYIKRRLKGLSYEELLFITSNTDMLDIYYFYELARGDSEESWHNLLRAITELRKRYKHLYN